FSAGHGVIGSSPALCRGPGDSAWSTAAGGFTPSGAPTGQPRDNSFYWIMIDFLKRASVVTAGFLDIYNPHRIQTLADTRLGPYFLTGTTPSLPQDMLPV